MKAKMIFFSAAKRLQYNEAWSFTFVKGNESVCVCVVEGGEGCSHLLLEVIKLLDSDSVKNTD